MKHAPENAPNAGPGKEYAMNGNRGQYTSSPMYNMKKRRVQPQRPPENQYQQPGAEAPREGKKYQGLSIVMSLVLPALFLISLFVPSNPLRWAFLIFRNTSYSFTPDLAGILSNAWPLVPKWESS